MGNGRGVCGLTAGRHPELLSYQPPGPLPFPTAACLGARSTPRPSENKTGLKTFLPGASFRLTGQIHTACTHHPSPGLTSCLFSWRLLGWARGGRSSQTLRVRLRSEDTLLDRLPTSSLMSRARSRSRAAGGCPDSLVSFHLEHSQRLCLFRL